METSDTLDTTMNSASRPDFDDRVSPESTLSDADGAATTSRSQRIYSALSLQTYEFPPEKWAIPRLLPEGATILAGKPKAGKSFLALTIAVAISRGEAALGTIPVEAGEVLYLALEDQKRRMYNRLRDMCDGVDLPKDLFVAHDWPRLGEGFERELNEYLHEHPRTRLVIVDTFAVIRPAHRGNSQPYNDDYDDIRRLKRIADNYRVAVLIVHHLRKMEAADEIDGVSGSAGLTGAADGLLVLRPKGDRHVLSMRGRDVESGEIPLVRDRRTCRWVQAGEESELSEERRRVIGALTGSPKPLGPTAIAKQIASNPEATKVLLAKMYEDQQIGKLGRGQYTALDNPAYLTYLQEREDAASAALGGSGVYLEAGEPEDLADSE